MKEVLINIPDDIQSRLELQARQQQLSLSEYIEKLIRVKIFSNTLDAFRNKISGIISEQNIMNEDDLNNYLKSK